MEAVAKLLAVQTPSGEKELNMMSIYEPTRTLADFHIAGFSYHEGFNVFCELKVGTKVELRHEPGNPYDPEAVAIYYGENMIGYVPRDKNNEFYTYLYFGHGDLFETFISTVDDDAHPERRLRVVVRISDSRPKSRKMENCMMPDSE